MHPTMFYERGKAEKMAGYWSLSDTTGPALVPNKCSRGNDAIDKKSPGTQGFFRSVRWLPIN